jgi:hypothetical protein
MLLKPIPITSLFVSNKRRFAVLGSVLLVGILSFEAQAQSKRQTPARNSLPRVGTIKDYPATGLMTGCGNWYYYPAARASSSDADYIFLARGDGDGAWMNLGGRDVRLRLIKSLTGKNRKPRRYFYRFGTLRITVLFEDFKPEDAPVAEGDHMFKMKITLQKGSVTRIVRAVGGSDC